ncbi:MAG TPA: hypothetical protein VH141_26170 [Pseudonocardia sp.]|nr:hypothetical protein [Pseudonocardia sp.]
MPLRHAPRAGAGGPVAQGTPAPVTATPVATPPVVRPRATPPRAIPPPRLVTTPPATARPATTRLTTTPPATARLTTTLLTTTLLTTTLLAGCGSPPTLAPPPLVTYTSLAQLGTATGNQMKADRTAKITVTGGTSGGATVTNTTGDGAIRFDPAGPSMQLTERIQSAGSPPAELGIIVLPDQAYVKPPADPSAPGVKPWVRIQEGASDPVSQQFASVVQSVRANADPTQSFTQFGDAASIVGAAEDPLDGVRAIRYSIRVDVLKAATQENDPTLKQSLEQTAQKGMATVDSSLWLDAWNHPLRVYLHQQLPGAGGTYTVDARYRDWGQPVQIAPPPPDQVAPS